MDGSRTPSTHQFHGIFPKWTAVLESVDALGKYKDAQFMGDLFIKTTEEVGVDLCVQIITDNAPVCKAASMIVEAKYPHVCSFFHF